MKKLFFTAFMFCTFAAIGKDSTRFALLYNVAQLPYQCYELNGLVDLIDGKLQLLGALNFTQGHTNDNQKRNRNRVDFNDYYMKKASDKIEGLGFGLQARYRIESSASGKWQFLCGLGFNMYNYKLKFYENEYVQNQSPFYHYTFVEHNERFTRSTTHGQIIINLSQNRFIMEVGVGIAYSNCKIPDAIEKYRIYHLSQMDYGYTGFGPVLSLRVGAWLF